MRHEQKAGLAVNVEKRDVGDGERDIPLRHPPCWSLDISRSGVLHYDLNAIYENTILSNCITLLFYFH